MKRDWPGWGQHDQQQTMLHYLVSPRHLAGGGDLGHVTAFLRASGWKTLRPHGPTTGCLALESPDRTVRVGYDMEAIPGGWTISGRPTAGQEAWHATFGRQTPVEIIAGLTDGLTRPHATHPANPWTPLRNGGWRIEHRTQHTATSPDATARFRYHKDAHGQPIWWTGVRDQGVAWEAVLTPTTPSHLVTAFTVALTSPDPVLRPHNHLPPSTLLHAEPVPLTPRQLGGWQQHRITTARADTWARNTPPARPTRRPASSRWR
ncbi:DUF317 domain-containing protein [Streptomyces sp. RFCAC02]|uniref:DUF317 domain-containing protein n=1 Tax=Streptomyces sp. RFCAC02 TaxID=2499143 RepID=UPI001F0D4238|nr:DUF317 domain-containing protein [Streptomyces sp. RFCAC02]